MLPGGWLAVLVAFVLLLLASAKAHGRQVRLLREQAGVQRVDFRADNGAVVEGIWRTDRRVFWATFVVALGVVLLRSLFGPWSDTWPLLGWLAIGLALAFCGSFIAAGLVAWARLARAGAGDPDWLRRANWGSFGWWSLVAAALALLWFAVR